VVGCAVTDPLGADEGRQSLGVVGDVGSVAAAASAVVGLSIRVAGVGGSLATAEKRASILLATAPGEKLCLTTLDPRELTGTERDVGRVPGVAGDTGRLSGRKGRERREGDSSGEEHLDDGEWM